jgi:hypothetical protein
MGWAVIVSVAGYTSNSVMDRSEFIMVIGRLGLLAVTLAGLLRGAPPQIWFAPLDDLARQNNASLGIIPSTDAGPTDYMNLFAPGAPWPDAASHVSVFKIYAAPFGSQFGSFSDAQFQEMFSFLNQHNIALAIEFGPLTPSGRCGVGIEGFEGNSVQTIVKTIKANGGTGPFPCVRLDRAVAEWQNTHSLR